MVLRSGRRKSCVESTRVLCKWLGDSTVTVLRSLECHRHRSVTTSDQSYLLCREIVLWWMSRFCSHFTITLFVERIVVIKVTDGVPWNCPSLISSLLASRYLVRGIDHWCSIRSIVPSRCATRCMVAHSNVTAVVRRCSTWLAVHNTERCPWRQ